VSAALGQNQVSANAYVRPVAWARIRKCMGVASKQQCIPPRICLLALGQLLRDKMKGIPLDDFPIGTSGARIRSPASPRQLACNMICTMAKDQSPLQQAGMMR